MHKLTPEVVRFHTTASFYHVVLSGNRRKALFATVDDRRALNQIATDALQRFDATLHAYCLMPNHFRALVQVDDRLLFRMLRRIATRYSHHRQRHVKPAWHLFERPYKAQRVDTDGDFLNLLRSIHLSPVIANRVIAPSDYLWSSHRAYLGYKSVSKVTTEFGLSLLAATPSQARIVYHQFIADGVAEDVGRVVKRKSPTASDNSTSDGLAGDRSVVDVSADTEAFATDHSLIDSRSPLPSKSTLSLPRFSETLRKTRSRFLSVY